MTTPEDIVRLGMSFCAAKTLLSAVELGVFGTLADGPLPLAELRRRTGLHPRAARDFLDALVALTLLDRHDRPPAPPAEPPAPSAPPAEPPAPSAPPAQAPLRPYGDAGAGREPYAGVNTGREPYGGAGRAAEAEGEAEGEGGADEEGPWYANTAGAERFLVPGREEYVGGLLEMAGERLYGIWGRLTEALRTGLPQNEARHGEDPFAAIYRDERRMRGFLRAMTTLSGPSIRALAERFPWDRHHRVADLGCAEGALPRLLAERHPHLETTGMDLPRVRDAFEEHVAGRARFAAGDFFADPLPEADVYVLGHVLHDWDRQTARRLLRKVRDALPPGGAVIVHEAFVDDDRRAGLEALLMSLTMLLETPGGSDRTIAECRALLADAGFTDIRAEPLAGAESMVTGTKPG
ncbi:methyltransferase [Bailinhaonella thermotolerans]|uniref:Methyltransferase domain-containing protein n=1 Tax=Bailinhaonella thermotolerans TaxID=1070861 RepID=A0A3A4A5P9_9ACTN|nr:methyltransferase [Bailinhaonella thermotolerans]RJL20826.1 methyltransferase domain-containing protein [Bailinhaonella thermotolerans]